MSSIDDDYAAFHCNDLPIWSMVKPTDSMKLL